MSLNQSAATKQIYAHYTCATDTQQIKCMCSLFSCLLSRLTYSASNHSCPECYSRHLTPTASPWMWATVISTPWPRLYPFLPSASHSLLSQLGTRHTTDPHSFVLSPVSCFFLFSPFFLSLSTDSTPLSHPMHNDNCVWEMPFLFTYILALPFPPSSNMPVHASSILSLLRLAPRDTIYFPHCCIVLSITLKVSLY